MTLLENAEAAFFRIPPDGRIAIVGMAYVATVVMRDGIPPEKVREAVLFLRALLAAADEDLL